MAGAFLLLFGGSFAVCAQAGICAVLLPRRWLPQSWISGMSMGGGIMLFKMEVSRASEGQEIRSGEY